MVETKDPYVGELFADADPRAEGRVVRVVELYEMAAKQNQTPKRYIIEVVKHHIDESLVGRRSVVTSDTLDTRYKKVSH